MVHVQLFTSPDLLRPPGLQLTLQHNLQKEYHINSGMHRATLDLSASDIVIARFTDYKLRYRRKVMEELNNEEFIVELYDTSGPVDISIAEELISRKVVKQGVSHSL